nr:hypothetical protein [Tanacetum cinerariifolium]
NLDNLIESQRSEKVKEGLGYNVVPPPAADLYLSPKKDLSWTGLPGFVDDTVTDYSRPSPTVASTSAEVQNKDSFTSEDDASPNIPKPFVKFVKPKDSQSKSETVKQETSESKVFDNSLCSNDCKKNNDSLNSKIKDLIGELSKANNYIYHYKLAVAQLEGRLTEYKEREVKYIEKIRTLEMYRASNLKCIKTLDKELEEFKLEKDGLDGKLAGLLKA